MNFVPKGEVYNKTQLNYNLNDFFPKNKAERTLQKQRKKKWCKWTQNEEKKHMNTDRKASFNSIFIEALNKDVELGIKRKP